MAKQVQIKKKLNQSAEARKASVPKPEGERFEMLNIIGIKYRQGMPVYEIQRHLLGLSYKLSVKSVYNYIGRLKKEWLENRLASIDEVVSAQLAKIDLVEFEAWEAWERSKKDFQKSFNKTIYEGEPKEGQKPKVKNHETSKTAQQTNGDNEFLKTVQWCIDKRLEIVGFGKLNIAIQNNEINIDNRVSQQFMGEVSIVREHRVRPADFVSDSPLMRIEQKDENFANE